MYYPHTDITSFIMYHSHSIAWITTKMKIIVPHVFSAAQVQAFTHSPFYYQLNPAALTINGKSAPSSSKSRCAGQIEISAMSIGADIFLSVEMY